MYGLTRYRRAISFIEELEKKPQSIQTLKKELKKTGYKIKSLEGIRGIFIILLYSSIVSTATSIFPEFKPLLKQILKISGIIGSTFCLIVIAVTSRYIALYTIDLQLIASKIISLQKK